MQVMLAILYDMPPPIPFAVSSWTRVTTGHHMDACFVDVLPERIRRNLRHMIKGLTHIVLNARCFVPKTL